MLLCILSTVLDGSFRWKYECTCCILIERCRTCALGPASPNKPWALMTADHSARGSMKTGVKPGIVWELQDTNYHRRLEGKWWLPIFLSILAIAWLASPCESSCECVFGLREWSVWWTTLVLTVKGIGRGPPKIASLAEASQGGYLSRLI